MKEALIWAAGGTGFTFLMTALGSALVFIFRKKVNPAFQKIFLGFAAGVMIAASVWSLIVPAVEQAESSGSIGFIPAAGGVLLGAAFLLLLDRLIPHLHIDSDKAEGHPANFKRTTLMTMAVTLHNIPEGMAVGLAFALAAQEGTDFTAAAALALGIGIQNFPEGAAISLPLREEGISSSRAFIRGSLSGIVEPIFGVLVVLIYPLIEPVMPWLLCFAAGAMIYVVVEELIPEAHLDAHSHQGTFGFIAGFVIMMVLDIALG
jgi:gufA protein